MQVFSPRTISGLILSQELACLPQVETDATSALDPASGAAAASLDAASESGKVAHPAINTYDQRIPKYFSESIMLLLIVQCHTTC